MRSDTHPLRTLTFWMCLCATIRAFSSEEPRFNTAIFNFIAENQKTFRGSEKWDGDWDISGMARLDKTRFVVAHDAKANSTRPRVGIISLTLQCVEYVPVASLWPDPAEPLHDLEAICELPHRPSEFLVAESGYESNRFGRVLRIKIDPGDGERSPSSAVRQTWRWPEETADIEGIAFNGSSTGGMLIAAKRDGILHLAPLMFDNSPSRLHFTRTLALPKAFPKDWREVSDLCIENNTVWAIAAFEGLEEGTAIGYGPFKSAIYNLASFDAHGSLRIIPTRERTVRWMDGFKAEALSLSHLPDSPFAIGTDDESLGGAWRLVSKP